MRSLDDGSKDGNRAGAAVKASAPILLAEVVRGDTVESRHWGHVSVVNGEGTHVVAAGTPEIPTFLRSSAKPFQALPLLVAGAASRFGLNAEELAVICGSHNGQEVHLRTVTSILEKVGLDASALACGSSEPYDPEAKRALREAGEAPTALHNTCSGKHAGMLVLARHLGAPTEGYVEAGHPVQRAVAATIARFASTTVDALGVGTDGCGVPTYALPLRTMAHMVVRLVAPADRRATLWEGGCARIVEAMMAHPVLVEGTAAGACLDTELMRALPGLLMAKSGAEDLVTAGIRPCAAWPSGLGIVVKIEDGDGKSRARAPIVLELLRQLGLLDAGEADALRERVAPPIENHRDERVAYVRPAFDLRADASGRPSAR